MAYRFFRHNGRHYRIADTPGHVQYVRNMAVAAANSDCALILVDASHGVREQTIRHSRIAAFFGIHHFIIAINKMDLAGYDEAKFKEITAAYKLALGNAEGVNLTFIPVSALEGDNLIARSQRMPWYQGKSLLEQIEATQVPAPLKAGARIPVQTVIRTADGRRAYLGMLTGGSLRVGDRLNVTDSGQSITVSELHHGGKSVALAHSGQAVALTSEDDADIARGSVLAVDSADLRMTDAFVGDVLWLDPAFAGMDNVQGILKMHTREEQAELHLQQESGATQEARVFTASPIALDAYARDKATGMFLVIQAETEKVIGVGTVRASETAEFNFAI